MKTKTGVTSTNGYHDTPPMTGGVSSITSKRRRTVFLPEIPARSFRSISYAVHRCEFGEIHGNYYITMFLALLAIIWATGLLPGRWIGACFFLILIAIQMVSGIIMKRRDFVVFHEDDHRETKPGYISDNTRLPVYVTGRLSVEGRDRRYTCVPGFYKTFATREHALLCQLRDRKVFRSLRWPIDEVGMWYAFFNPRDVIAYRRGKLIFGANPLPTLAIEIERCQTKAKRFSSETKEDCEVETLFISSEDENVLEQIASDIYSDMYDN